MLKKILIYIFISIVILVSGNFAYNSFLDSIEITVIAATRRCIKNELGKYPLFAPKSFHVAIDPEHRRIITDLPNNYVTIIIDSNAIGE